MDPPRQKKTSVGLNLRHLTTEPANTQVEGLKLGTLGTREGGNLARVTQHPSFPLIAQMCAPSSLCWRSESQSTIVHSIQLQSSTSFPQRDQTVHLPSVCLPSVSLLSS